MTVIGSVHPGATPAVLSSDESRDNDYVNRSLYYINATMQVHVICCVGPFPGEVRSGRRCPAAVDIAVGHDRFERTMSPAVSTVRHGVYVTDVPQGKSFSATWRAT